MIWRDCPIVQTRLPFTAIMLYVLNSHQLTQMNFEKKTTQNNQLNLHMAVLVGNEANESRSDGELTEGPKRKGHR